MFDKKRIIKIIIFVVVISSSLYFGLPRLDNFSGVDEPYWSYDRVPKFWNSVKIQKWRSTNICDKPGVPLAIVSGTGLPFISENIKDLGKLRYKEKTESELQSIRGLYHKLRIPVFVFTLLILPLFYFLIKKLLGEKTANFSLIFIGLSPILLGISLIINSDSILWILTALSTLSLFNFFKSDKKKYLLLAGFSLGLSVITKYVANILFIYFFLLFFLEYIFWAYQKIKIGSYIKKAFLNYLVLIAVSTFTAFIFFPATWVKSSVLWNATLGNEVFSSTWPVFAAVILFFGIDILIFKSKASTFIFRYLVKYKKIIWRLVPAIFSVFSLIVFLYVFFKVKLYDLEGFISSPKGIGIDSEVVNQSLISLMTADKIGSFWHVLNQYIGAVSADIYSLFFSISPLVLISILVMFFFLFRQKEMKRDSITAIYIIIFFLAFYLGSAVNNVTTTVRYQIMIYPLAFILAAIGMKTLLDNVKFKEKLKFPLAYLLIIIILLISLFQIKPHFLAYASELLPKNLIVNLKGMGEGSIEAGNYLNNLSGAHEMTIWSDKGAVCESFVGKCHIKFREEIFTENQFDYFVVSTDRRSRSLKMSGGSVNEVDFRELYKNQNPEFEVIIGGREVNFVKVIKNNFSKE